MWKSGYLLIGMLLLLSVYLSSSMWQFGSMEHGKHELLARGGLAGSRMDTVSSFRFSDSAGGRIDVGYLQSPRVPERVLAVAGDYGADLPPLEPESQAQTDAAGQIHGGNRSDANTPAAGDYGARPQPSTRGSLRVWVTHYAAGDLCTAGQIRRDQCITASGHPLRVGHAASYPVRAGRDIVGANLGHPDVPELRFGAWLVVEELGAVTVMDTGAGPEDHRPWLDVAVESSEIARQLGAGWRTIEILEAKHD